MACVDGMEHEAAFAAALEQARSFRILGQHLELLGSDGDLLAVSKPGPRRDLWAPWIRMAPRQQTVSDCRCTS